MRGFCLLSVLVLVGCHVTPTISDPVLRLEGQEDFYTLGGVLDRFGQATGATTSRGPFQVDDKRLVVPVTTRLSLSEFRALLYAYHIGLEVEREGEEVRSIAMRLFTGEETDRNSRTQPFGANDSVAVSFYPCTRYQDLEIAHQTARRVQRDQVGQLGVEDDWNYDDVGQWPAPPIVMMEDLPGYLPAQVEALSRTVRGPAPPAADGGYDTVYPFSLLLGREFFGLD